MSDDDIDGQVAGNTKSPAIFFVTARQRLTKNAGVERSPDWTSGDGGYEAGLKGSTADNNYVFNNISPSSAISPSAPAGKIHLFLQLIQILNLNLEFFKSLQQMFAAYAGHVGWLQFAGSQSFSKFD